MAWSEIYEQDLALQTLQRDLARQRLAPAYLFVGPEGVGKRLSALEMAKAINCGSGGHDGSCGACDACRRMARGVHPDLHVLSARGASETIRIEEVRQALARIALRPFMARYQMVIIDGVEHLTEEAGNLLLKSLEEPPEQARFLLLTSQLTACLPTIVSRCKRIRFQRLSPDLIESLLVSQGSCDPRTAASVSRLAQGSVSRAVELAQRWVAYQEMLAQFGSERSSAWLEWPVPTDRKELAPWLGCAITWLRDVAVASLADETLLHHRASAVAIRRQAHAMDRAHCVDSALELVELWQSLEQMANPRLVGTLLREEWLELLGQGAGDGGHGR